METKKGTSPYMISTLSIVGLDKGQKTVRIATNIKETDEVTIITNPDGTTQTIKGSSYDYVDVQMAESDAINRDSLINGIIRNSYTPSEEFSILRHHNTDPTGYAEEWTAYNDVVAEAKKFIDGILK
jgi:hypothetical protein